MAANNAKLPPEIDQLTQKLVADPKSRVFAQLADAYRKIGMIDEAIETAKRGLEIHPNYAIAHNILGRCYLEKKMYALAVEEFQLTIRADPQNLVAYKMLATAHEKQGAVDEALKYYRMVLDLEPGEIEAAQKVEQLAASAGGVQARPQEAAPEPVPDAPAPEPEPQPETTPLPQAETPVPPSEESPAAAAVESLPLPAALQQPELEIEPAPEPFTPAPAVPVAPDAAAPADGEATPTLADIYAQQGHYEKAIEVYQKLVAENPDNDAYKARLDELLAKAYPEEAPQSQPPESAAQPAPEPPQQEAAAPSAADAPDNMFSKMFAQMEQVAGSGGSSIPDQVDAKGEPPAPDPAREEAAPPPPPAPAAPEPAVTPAPEAPVDFGALFAGEQKAPDGAGDGAAPAGGEAPKKDEAVSSFQSWLNSLQK